MNEGPRTYRVGDPVPGTKWVVAGVLGRGGMGVVLDVRKEPGITGAMKVMRPAFARSPEFVSRFLDEARVLVQLRHPNIVQVLDCDTLADGSPFLVMERLEGRSLRAAARELSGSGRRLTTRNVWEIARQVCEGLYRAHSHEPIVVHADLKPDNIYLHQPEFGEPAVKLLDFGIAQVLEDTVRAPHSLVGTPRYMSPEMLRHETVSPKADLYSVGLVIYELLTLRFPWDIDVRKISAITQAHLSRPPVAASQFAPWLPKSVDACLAQALAKDPKDRQRDVHELGRQLFELQFADDGSSHLCSDANTTALTLGTLAIGRTAGRAKAPAEQKSPATEVAPLEIALDIGEIDAPGSMDTTIEVPDPGAVPIVTGAARGREPESDRESSETLTVEPVAAKRDASEGPIEVAHIPSQRRRGRAKGLLIAVSLVGVLILGVRARRSNWVSPPLVVAVPGSDRGAVAVVGVSVPFAPVPSASLGAAKEQGSASGPSREVGRQSATGVANGTVQGGTKVLQSGLGLGEFARLGPESRGTEDGAGVPVRVAPAVRNRGPALGLPDRASPEKNEARKLPTDDGTDLVTVPR